MTLHPLNAQTVSDTGSLSEPAAPKGRVRSGHADHTHRHTPGRISLTQEPRMSAAARSPRRKSSRSQPPASFAPAYGLPPLELVRIPAVHDAVSAVRNLGIALGSLEMIGHFGGSLALSPAFDANILHSGLALLRSFDEAFPVLEEKASTELLVLDVFPLQEDNVSRDYVAFAMKQMQAAREAAPQIERQFLGFAVAHLRVSEECRLVLSELLRRVEQRVAA